MTIEWKDSYEIGDAVIDAEHKQLFRLANQFLAAGGQAVQQAAAMQLYKHAREHFEHEENLMRVVKFPDVKAHTERHNQMIAQLNDVSRGIGQGVLDGQALHALMRDWAMNHVAHDDVKLITYLTKG